MGGLFAPACVVSLALGVLALEAVVIARCGGEHRATRLAGVAAGSALLLAVGLALTGDGVGVIVLIAVGGVAHAAELASRRRDPRAR